MHGNKIKQSSSSNHSSSMFLISTLQPLHPLLLQKMNGIIEHKSVQNITFISGKVYWNSISWMAPFLLGVTSIINSTFFGGGGP